MAKFELNRNANDIALVWTTMLFPDNEALRRQVLAVHMARKQLMQSDRGDEFAVTRETLQLLVDAPSDDEIKRLVAASTKRATIVGNMLAGMYLMDLYKIPEPSMNKAKYLAKEMAKMTKYGDGSPIQASEPTVLGAA